jgi:membrane protein DedA with SNARE-associated domain
MELFTHILTLPDFSELSKHLGYIGIFLFFITVDQLTPLPEEITLLTIGYLASNNIFNPFFAGIASVMAFWTIDLIYFFLARSGNKFIEKFISRKKKSLINKYKEKLKKHFGITLIVLSFIPRMRLLCPVFAAMMNFPFNKFLLFNTIGLALFTAVYISLGMIFHNSLHAQIAELEALQHIIFAIAMFILAALILAFVLRTQQK